MLERTGILLVLGVLVVVFALREPAFLNLDNLFSILQAVSIVALLGIGVTVTLAAGGFDLSVGSVAATAQMAASYVLVVWHGSAWAAVLACVVQRGRRLVQRLADYAAARARPARDARHAVPAGRPAVDPDRRPFARDRFRAARRHGRDGRVPDAFLALGRLRVFDVVPLPVLLLAAVTVLACVTMEATRWGRVIYAIGGETAARLAGAPGRATASPRMSCRVRSRRWAAC